MSSYTPIQFAFKIQVDTYRSARLGVPRLVNLFKKYDIPASFFFCFGPDNTGKRIHRIFKPNSFRKTSLLQAVRTYGINALLYGTVIHPPLIAQSNEKILKQVKDAGFEVGIGAYDPFEWEDFSMEMSGEDVIRDYEKAIIEFKNIFDASPHSIASPAWQTNVYNLQMYDDLNLLYSSDTRGGTPFFPVLNDQSFRTLQIPTTLNTLEELLAKNYSSLGKINDYYLDNLQADHINVHTLYAKIEGMSRFNLLEDLIQKLKVKNVEFISLETVAKNYLKNKTKIPFCKIVYQQTEDTYQPSAYQGPVI